MFLIKKFISVHKYLIKYVLNYLNVFYFLSFVHMIIINSSNVHNRMYAINKFRLVNIIYMSLFSSPLLIYKSYTTGCMCVIRKQ